MRNCLAHFAYNGRQLLNLNNLRAGKLAQEPCHFTSKVQIENCWSHLHDQWLPDYILVCSARRLSPHPDTRGAIA